MEEIKRILVVSRATTYCRKAIHYGVSLARKYNAELYVVHVVYDPFIFGGWNLPFPSMEIEYSNLLKRTREELHDLIESEKKSGMVIKELLKEGEPTEALLQTVEEEKIDLLIMLAHEEGHLEHFLFGRSNEAIVRSMPCSVFLVKKEPERVNF